MDEESIALFNLKFTMDTFLDLCKEIQQGEHDNNNDLNLKMKIDKIKDKLVSDVSAVANTNSHTDLLADYLDMKHMLDDSDQNWMYYHGQEKDLSEKPVEAVYKFQRQVQDEYKDYKRNNGEKSFIKKDRGMAIQQYLGVKLDLTNPIKSGDFDPNETWRQCQIAAREAGIRASGANYDGNTLYFQAGKSGKSLYKFKVTYVYQSDTYDVQLVYINMDIYSDDPYQAYISRKVEDVYASGLAQVFESLWRDRNSDSGWTELKGTEEDKAEEDIE